MVALVNVLVCGLFGLVNSVVHHDICDEIMFVDCTTEALPGNKIYRDNSGKIYDNFCTYSQAKCRDASIDLESVCTCVHPDIHVQINPDSQTFIHTTAIQNLLLTTALEITKIPTSTFKQLLESPKPTPNTTAVMVETSTLPTSEMVQPTITSEQTTDTLVSLFCQNKDLISCPLTPDPVCGSDNVSYINRCEFAKAKCVSDNVSIVREGSCS